MAFIKKSQLEVIPLRTAGRSQTKITHIFFLVVFSADEQTRSKIMTRYFDLFPWTKS